VTKSLKSLVLFLLNLFEKLQKKFYYLFFKQSEHLVDIMYITGQ